MFTMRRVMAPRPAFFSLHARRDINSHFSRFMRHASGNAAQLTPRRRPFQRQRDSACLTHLIVDAGMSSVSRSIVRQQMFIEFDGPALDAAGHMRLIHFAHFMP